MERLTMIDGCGNNELARCMDCGIEKAGEDLENCGMCEEGWQRALKRLAAYEDTGLEPCEYAAMREAMEKGERAKEHLLYMSHILRNIGLDRVMELLKAEQEGRIKILPQSESGTCGSCGHFKRIPGMRCGTCEVRSRWTNRRGQIYENRGAFTPSQSRKACKQYLEREEAEAAMEGGKDHA